MKYIIQQIVLVFFLFGSSVSAIDTDSDGVEDQFDIDDDNDGIVDSLEGSVLPNNGGFEEPVANTTTWTLINDTDVPFWQTTAADHKIEFWKSGFQGVPAYEGNQFVEMNANVVASLYQDISVIEGDIVSWKIAHRGRSGTDVATVSVGVPGSPLSVLTTMSDGNTAWGVYSGTYTIPAGMTVIRISFDSVSSAGGASIGNFIDGTSLIVVKDDDGDGSLSNVDLDSDNDGIPDNVEAQPTDGFLVADIPWADADGDGLADQYDPDFPGSTPVILPDTDDDGIPDFLDSDSDNDNYTDCEEGQVGSICPILNNDLDPVTGLGINGMIYWAELDDVYNDLGNSASSGDIDEPNPDQDDQQMQDEIIGNNQAAYREVACGRAETNLTAYQWKTISFPCDTGGNGIETLLKDSLGDYGDENNWVVYKQTGNYMPDGKSETSLMNAGDPVEPGNGYWIIADADKVAKITRPLSGISQTPTEPASNFPGLPVTGAAFEEVMPYALPDSDSTDPRILMIGNPFFKKFQLSDMYYQNADMGTTDYQSTTTLISGTSPLEPTVYVKDSSDTTTGNYTAITPETPGFGDVIPTMQGFWIKLNAGNTQTNKITYPFEK